MMLLESFEYEFHCPYCLAPITMLLDPSVPNQEYIEDCEVCCNPIEVKYAFTEDVLEYFSAEQME